MIACNAACGSASLFKSQVSRPKPGGNLHKVDASRIGRRKNALFIEQTLLLMYQSQRVVIHQDDFHIQLVFHWR
ncbi:Uncharacterised protein [Salmonella sp. NCTC 11881]|nr:Uncharacterised protein [Salmonella sp. NCTC 11881]